jgi:endonuclease I
MGLWCLLVGAVGAPPAGYYDPAAGQTGGDLKQALHTIIRGHTVIPYGSLFTPLRNLWADPTNSSNVILTYSLTSVAGSSSWNREHLWPRSRGNSAATGPDDSDLFHVVPTDITVNSERGSLYFDASNPNDPVYRIPAHPLAPQTSRDSDSWQPAPSERGDIARAMFYMDVRYNGSDPETTDMDLVSFPPSGSQMGNLNTLLLWHAQDPPDDAERARNDLIFSNYQGNRNPFIDHPEYAEAIWGTGNPGDPTSAPLARVLATSTTAAELPSSVGRFVISLNQFAGTNGITVNLIMSGAATPDEYALSGSGVTYDPLTGVGSVVVPPNFSSAVVVLTPVADGMAESPETALLTLQGGVGYDITPDASSAATVTIRDTPGLPVGWSFNEGTFSSATNLPANRGDGAISFASWLGTLSSFSGVTNTSLALVGSAGNGSSVEFRFSMAGHRDLSLKFWTRGTTTGYNSGVWSFSTNGTDFVTNTAVNTATRSTTFAQRTVDFSGFTALNNAPEVTMRYTLNGATSAAANNRLDELEFSATPYAIGSGAREVSLVAVNSAARELASVRGVLSFRLNGPAPETGLTVAFQMSGTAQAGVDYLVAGAASFDATSGAGTVFFPANTDTVLVDIIPQEDVLNEPLETVIGTLVNSLDSSYLLGTAASAVVTISDLRNDDFSQAIVLSGSPVTTTGSNVGATREDNEPWHLGGASNNGGRSVWWSWTAPWSGPALFSTQGSSFDTVLALYTGSSLGALTRVAFNDDGGPSNTSRLVHTVTAGTTYYLAVDGYSTAAGSITLFVGRDTSLGLFSPTSGPPGTTVTIDGINLGAASVLTFNGQPAAFSVVSDTQLRAIVPPSATSGVIRVTTPDGSASTTAAFVVLPGTVYGSWAAGFGLDPSAAGARALDLDADGLVNWLEFTFGRSPVRAEGVPPLRVEPRLFVDPADGVEKLFPALLYERSTSATNAVFVLEASPSLETPDWQPGSPWISTTPVPGAAREEVLHRAAQPLDGGAQFFRLKVSEP